MSGQTSYRLLILICSLIFLSVSGCTKSEEFSQEVRDIDNIQAEQARYANELNDKYVKKAEDLKVQAQLRNIRTAFYAYLYETDKIPDSSEGLSFLTEGMEFISPEEIVDPWGREYLYRADPAGADAFEEEYNIYVYSAGPDGIPDNSDDISIK